MRGPAHLFVYGTLRGGSTLPPARLLARRATFACTASVRGALFHLGSYPGLVIDDAADDWIPGDVFSLPDDRDLLAALDAYEGCGAGDPQPHAYQRVAARARRDDGVEIDVWVYAYRGAVLRERRIPEWPWPPAPRS
jgi:gamma-glutamylcyclotransferase (GGCT)/AIG2-like uncharacterized protein YtfP